MSIKTELASQRDLQELDRIADRNKFTCREHHRSKRVLKEIGSKWQGPTDMLFCTFLEIATLDYSSLQKKVSRIKQGMVPGNEHLLKGITNLEVQLIKLFGQKSSVFQVEFMKNMIISAEYFYNSLKDSEQKQKLEKLMQHAKPLTIEEWAKLKVTETTNNIRLAFEEKINEKFGISQKSH